MGLTPSLLRALGPAKRSHEKYLKDEALLKIARATVVTGLSSAKHAASVLHNTKFKSNRRSSKSGLTFLHFAAESGDAVFVEILIASGADLNVTTRDCGSTPLLLASVQGHTDCVKLLLEHGALPNLCDLWQNSPLYKASCYNFDECLRVLLQHGADPNLGNKWGALPLQHAVRGGHVEIISTLLDSGCDVTLPGELDALPPLASAAVTDAVDAVRLLLERGADVNYSYQSDGKTALYHCVLAGVNDWRCVPDRLPVITTLVQAGAEITVPCEGFAKYSDLVLPNFAYDPTLHRDKLVKVFENYPALREKLYELGLSMTAEEAAHESIKQRQTEEGIKDMWMTPRSLQSICRVKVRSFLRPNVSVCVNKLPVPAHIASYIAL